MISPLFPPLEVTTQDTLGALSFLLAQRASEISAVPATSTIAAYLVDERRFPHPSVEYPTGAPAEHLALLTPGEVPTPSLHAATADGVVLRFTEAIAHNGFSLSHAAALFGNVAALRTLPLSGVTSHDLTVLHAAAGGSLPVVRFILENLPGLIDILDKDGQSCLFVACTVGRHLDVVMYLVGVKKEHKPPLTYY